MVPHSSFYTTGRALSINRFDLLGIYIGKGHVRSSGPQIMSPASVNEEICSSFEGLAIDVVC